MKEKKGLKELSLLCTVLYVFLSTAVIFVFIIIVRGYAAPGR